MRRRYSWEGMMTDAPIIAASVKADKAALPHDAT